MKWRMSGFRVKEDVSEWTGLMRRGDQSVGTFGLSGLIERCG